MKPSTCYIWLPVTLIAEDLRPPKCDSPQSGLFIAAWQLLCYSAAHLDRRGQRGLRRNLVPPSREPEHGGLLEPVAVQFMPHAAARNHSLKKSNPQLPVEGRGLFVGFRRSDGSIPLRTSLSSGRPPLYLDLLWTRRLQTL